MGKGQHLPLLILLDISAGMSGCLFPPFCPYMLSFSFPRELGEGTIANDSVAAESEMAIFRGDAEGGKYFTSFGPLTWAPGE